MATLYEAWRIALQDMNAAQIVDGARLALAEHAGPYMPTPAMIREFIYAQGWQSRGTNTPIEYKPLSAEQASNAATARERFFATLKGNKWGLGPDHFKGK